MTIVQRGMWLRVGGLVGLWILAIDGCDGAAAPNPASEEAFPASAGVRSIGERADREDKLRDHGSPRDSRVRTRHCGGEVVDHGGGAGRGGGRGGAVGSAGRGGPLGGGGAGGSEVGSAGGRGGELQPPPPPNNCPVFIPVTPLLTGSAQTVAAPSFFYTFAAPGLTAPIVTAQYDRDGVWQSLDVVATPGIPSDAENTWVGLGVPVFGCVDARAFVGIKFTLAGDLGTCRVTLEVVARNNNSVLYGGACTASLCYGASSGSLSVGTSVVRFDELTGGSPNATLDASQINDFSWRIVVPSDGVSAPCSGRFIISDISFVGN